MSFRLSSLVARGPPFSPPPPASRPRVRFAPLACSVLFLSPFVGCPALATSFIPPIPVADPLPFSVVCAVFPVPSALVSCFVPRSIFPLSQLSSPPLTPRPFCVPLPLAPPLPLPLFSSPLASLRPLLRCLCPPPPVLPLPHRPFVSCGLHSSASSFFWLLFHRFFCVSALFLVATVPRLSARSSFYFFTLHLPSPRNLYVAFCLLVLSSVFVYPLFPSECLCLAPSSFFSSLVFPPSSPPPFFRTGTTL